MGAALVDLLAVRGPGELIGELALLERTRRNATVRAIEATKLLILDSRDLHALMERNTDIAEHIESDIRACIPNTDVLVHVEPRAPHRDVDG